MRAKIDGQHKASKPAQAYQQQKERSRTDVSEGHTTGKGANADA